jgi:fused signal recognition particle receptor
VTPLLLIVVVVAACVVGVVVLSRRPSGRESPRDVPSAPPSRVEGLGSRVRALFGRGVSADTWRELEEALLKADVGPRAAADLVSRIRADFVEGADPGALLRDEVVAVLGRDEDLNLPGDRLAVVMVVGVNGSGKTTTIGKLAKRFVDGGKKVSLAASDTFRAAAGEQLEVWAARAGAHLVSQERGADPGAVAFDAVKSATARGSDVLIVDTAGRLHTKTPLMDELAKLKRVIEKARAFTEAVDVSCVALTKLDGSARGGIVLAVREELGVPVRLVGVGEGVADLRPFDARAFADRLVDG